MIVSPSASVPVEARYSTRSVGVQGEARRVERLLLAVFALVGVMSVVKGLSSEIVNGVDFYWMIDYRHGFIKRALIGTVFRPVLTYVSGEHLKLMVLGLHVVACLSIVYVFHGLFWRAIRHEERVGFRLTLAFSFLCLMCCPLLPSLAYIVGYLDVYFILLALAGFWLVLDGKYVAAALVTSVGPVIHESFVFLWSPVVIMLIWSCITTKRHVMTKLLAVALPAFSAVAVAALHSQAAAVRAIQPLPLPDDVKERAIIQLGFTLLTSFDHMWKYEYPGRLANVAASAVYFLFPSAAILWATGFAYWRRWTHPSPTLLVAIVATVAPLTLLAVVWDLSRFLVWSNLAAALVLIGLGSPALLSRSSAEYE